MDIGAAAYGRFLEGDNSGLEEIIAEYKDALILYMVGLCGSITEAEDLMEDVFVKLVTDRPVFRGKSTFKTWLFAIAGNVARDYLRRSRKRSFVPLEDGENYSREAEDLLQDYYRSEEKLILHKCMNKLKTEYKQVLFLSFFEGFNNSEIARIMHRTNRQIENLLYRAKKSLGEELRKEGYDYEN